MTCAECDEGCLDGTTYGYCTDDRCAGLCEPLGSCACECHQLREVSP